MSKQRIKGIMTYLSWLSQIVDYKCKNFDIFWEFKQLQWGKSDINTRDSSYQIWLMGATFDGKMNQSVTKTLDINLWCLYLISLSIG